LESSCNLAIGGFLFYGCATTDLVDSPEKNELARKKLSEALQVASLTQRKKCDEGPR
jgi:hypothetical protein